MRLSYLSIFKSIYNTIILAHLKIKFLNHFDAPWLYFRFFTDSHYRYFVAPQLLRLSRLFFQASHLSFALFSLLFSFSIAKFYWYHIKFIYLLLFKEVGILLWYLGRGFKQRATFYDALCNLHLLSLERVITYGINSSLKIKPYET